MGAVGTKRHNVLHHHGIVGVAEAGRFLMGVLQPYRGEMGTGPGQHHVSFFQGLVVKVITVGFLKIHLTITNTRRPLGCELVNAGNVPAFIGIIRRRKLVQLVPVEVFAAECQLLFTVVAIGSPLPDQIGNVKVFAGVAGTMTVAVVMPFFMTMVMIVAAVSGIR